MNFKIIIQIGKPDYSGLTSGTKFVPMSFYAHFMYVIARTLG